MTENVNVLDALRDLRAEKTNSIAAELQADNQRYWADGVVPLARRQPSKLSAGDLDAILQRLAISPEQMELHVGELRLIFDMLPETQQALAAGQERERRAPKLVADASAEWEKAQTKIVALQQRQAELLDVVQYENRRATQQRAGAEGDLVWLDEKFQKLVASGFSVAFSKRPGDRVEVMANEPEPLPIATAPVETVSVSEASPAVKPTFRSENGRLVVVIDGVEHAVSSGVPDRDPALPPLSQPEQEDHNTTININEENQP